jgi:hypothetical protein
MKNPIWRGRLLTLSLACCTLMATGGCTGLTDRQLSSMFQSVLTTGLTTLVGTIISALAGGTTPTTP